MYNRIINLRRSYKVLLPGVTILTVQPSADNITTVTEDTEPFDKTSSSVSAVKTSRQDSVGVAWTKPPDEEHIDGVCESLMHSIIP